MDDDLVYGGLISGVRAGSGKLGAFGFWGLGFGKLFKYQVPPLRHPHLESSDSNSSFNNDKPPRPRGATSSTR